MTTGIVFDIKRFSIHDGPGIRTTVFLKGCPLNCWWCHNPEGQRRRQELVLRPDRCMACRACLEVCDAGAVASEQNVIVTERERCTACFSCVEVCYAGARELAGHRMTVAEVMDKVERDVAFYDQSGGGVTFSGGEPLSQPAFLCELLRSCKERSLHTALDTCGFAGWDVLEKVRGDVDLFLYDLKLMDDVRHRQAAGATNEPILENLQRLSQHGHRIIIRIPIIPGTNDDKKNIEAAGVFASDLPSLDYVQLLPYHQIGRHKYGQLGKACAMSEVGPPSDEHLAEIARRLRGHGLEVKRE